MTHFGDEIWDEERWESFLRESDERVRRYMDLLFRFLNDHPPPSSADRRARRLWEDRLRLFLREKGFDQDPSQPSFLDESGFDDAPAAETDLDEVDDHAPRFGVRGIPVYQSAFELASRVLEWTNALPGGVKDSELVQFCSAVTQVPANIAKGHGIGYERDMIGGNIACAKRALGAANTALDQLRELKAAPYMDRPFYNELYEQLFEVRNALGLYVQELRSRFHLGID